MLDSLIMDYNAILARLHLSRSKLESSEDMVPSPFPLSSISPPSLPPSQVSLRLDTARNQLLITNTIISVVALAFAFGSYVGSIWGMNLDSNLQEAKGLFWGVTIGTTLAMGLLVLGILSYLQATEIIPKKVALISNRLIRTW
jgi:hypothetical protein